MKASCKKRRFALRKLGCVFVCLLVVLLVAGAALLAQLEGKVSGVERIDSEGLLYSVDYNGDYDNPLYTLPLRLLQSKSCTSFTFKSESGDEYTARNFDIPHKDADGNLTGLNVVVQLNPTGRYRSINVADAAMLSYLDESFSAGALDTSAAQSPLLALLPYLCMDGLNEKGLTCSIMYLDVREGDKPTAQNQEGKDDVVITELLRHVLDNCASTNEAVQLAKEYNMHGVFGGDYHLLVNDISGHSVVLEWQNNELMVVESDTCTNFYLSSSDAQDSYSKGVLREKWTGPADTKYSYTYGYGHGYERFKTAVTALDLSRSSADEQAVMTKEDARDVLAAVTQDYEEGKPTSMTQYSALYNANTLALDIWVQQDFEHCYSFVLSDNAKGD